MSLVNDIIALEADPELKVRAIKLSSPAGRILALAQLDYLASMECSREENTSIATRVRILGAIAAEQGASEVAEQHAELVAEMKITAKIMAGSGARNGGSDTSFSNNLGLPRRNS